MTKEIFINYRRVDTAPFVRNLKESLEWTFGKRVFTDVEGIDIADNYPKVLEDSLAEAKVLLVVIGSAWLTTSDQYGRRRIDAPNDWVRKEIEVSLARDLPIIPVLVNRAKLPPPEALPESIVGLLDRQAIELRDEHWADDLEPLIKRLASPPIQIPQRPGPAVPTKIPSMVPRALTHDEIDKHLSNLPEWQIETSPLPGGFPKTRTELTRRYTFKNFVQAIDFMHSSVATVEGLQHHPRWENTFRTVTVWLTTWDIGHVPSQLDFDLANALDKLYEGFPGKSSKS
jgi:pterin-4a-carbinolamine dehydratase